MKTEDTENSSNNAISTQNVLYPAETDTGGKDI